MSNEFGESVRKESTRLKESGMDANQIAGVLVKNDKAGANYGIGIILDEKGKPAASSSTLVNFAKKEIEASLEGEYKNSNAILESVKKAVLAWQRIPEALAPKFKLLLPSDAGSGSLQTALQAALLLNQGVTALGIEELGWPAYKALAKVARVGVKEFSQGSVIDEKNILPVYQAGPMNTTGFVQNLATLSSRAKTASKNGTWVVLDRAYSGFEFARELNTSSYDDVMRKSFELQIKPFLDANTPFLMAVSPTKAFVTFALRPCGFLLVFNPDSSKDKEVTAILNTVIRARGSSFEHVVTRAFAKAMVNDRAGLEREHQAALGRLAAVEKQWKTLAQGTPLEAQFSERYAGLFRNPKVKEEGPVNIYNEHIYPVFSDGRCRLNVTGLPFDGELAKKHVTVFSQYCV